MFLISFAKSLPRLASIAAFLCLVVAHLEWPLIPYFLRVGCTSVSLHAACVRARRGHDGHHRDPSAPRRADSFHSVMEPGGCTVGPPPVARALPGTTTRPGRARPSGRGGGTHRAEAAVPTGPRRLWSP